MYLKSLELKNYRNYNHIDLKFDKNSILLVGNNGNGKTNLLEAIHYLSTGCSHRTHIQDELIKWGRTYSLLRANIGSSGEHRDRLLEIEIRKNNDIKIRIDRVYCRKKTDFVQLLPSVIFSPDDLKIIKSNPGERRSFLDSILEKIYRDFYRCRLQYNKILVQRNSLLRSAGGKLNNNHINTLGVWNDNLVKYGTEIITKRCELLDNIRLKFKDYIGGFFKGTDSDIEYIFSWERSGKAKSYNPRDILPKNSCMNKVSTIDGAVLREIFKNKLNENLERDLARKTTTIGPHRDDLAVFFGGKDIRSFGSQGQQRISSVSLKLCELYILKNRLKADPILLLDDVLSELDIDRWKKLVDVINKKSQTFVTSTNSSYFDKLDIDFQKKYLIKNNKVNIM